MMSQSHKAASVGKAAVRRASPGIVFLGLVSAGVLVAVPASADPSSAANDAINAHYAQFGGAGSLLGGPTGGATDIAGGAERNYQGGAIFYSSATGAKTMYGDILQRYRALGGPDGSLGFPTNDESDAGNGVARFNTFNQPGGAAIYWSPDNGARVLKGHVLEAYQTSGGAAGPFGSPNADMASQSGTQAATFTGPAATDIRWSDTAGLSTVPASVAGSLIARQPALRAPTASAPAASASTSSSGSSGINRWWALPIGLVIAAVVGGILGMFGRRRHVAAGPRTMPTGRGPIGAVPDPGGRMPTQAQRFGMEPEGQRGRPMPDSPRGASFAQPSNAPSTRNMPRPAAPNMPVGQDMSGMRPGAPNMPTGRDASGMRPGAPNIPGPQDMSRNRPAPADMPEANAPAGRHARQGFAAPQPSRITEDPAQAASARREQAMREQRLAMSGAGDPGGIQVVYENNALGADQQSAKDGSTKDR
ncbi:LGFP repeat-containing protein [Nocardia alni]|uniref:LGFP repeat-containing protein n=1 Tax=Nocardia alni TaxID=2815723 RepID=UPI001C217FFA|nr:hypothetical protein [Nocardia alni]